MVLNDKFVRAQIADTVERGDAEEEVHQRAREIIENIAADMSYGWLRVLDQLCEFLWNRIYDGVVVEDEGISRFREAARKGPIVLVPSHKSHIDYLLLSQILYRRGIMPPHIAAGDNLNFPPIGKLLRATGGFFLRRSFGSDRLYAAIFTAYVRRLLKDGNPVEFFIEGGRSRTGKLLMPKMGMLKMCVDPVINGSLQDVSFMPVSIGYEKLIEAQAYAEELGGKRKKKESMSNLLSSAQILRSKYGRVYVDFAEPISLRVFGAARGFSFESSLHGEETATRKTRDLVTQLGHRIIFGINAVTRVTPTSVAALILLAETKAQISERILVNRARQAIEIIRTLGPPISTTLETPEKQQAALREALERFVSDKVVEITQDASGGLIYKVLPKGRQTLDYYKNNILHFLVPTAIIATVLLSENESTHENALAQAKRISHLLKHEFSFRTGLGFEENFTQASQLLLNRKSISREEDEDGQPLLWRTTKGENDELHVLSGLLGVFFETYRLVATCLGMIADTPMSTKKFINFVLSAAKKHSAEKSLARSECASKVTIENAVQLFLDDRIISRSGGRVHTEDENARQRLIEELSGYLEAIDADNNTGRQEPHSIASASSTEPQPAEKELS